MISSNSALQTQSTDLHSSTLLYLRGFRDMVGVAEIEPGRIAWGHDAVLSLAYNWSEGKCLVVVTVNNRLKSFLFPVDASAAYINDWLIWTTSR